jgi:8-amino-7-oxononanoate synthase
MIEGFHDMGFETGKTETPIVPVMIGPMEEAFLMWKELFERGIYTNAVLPPAVPEGSCRLRTSYIATHTDDQLDYVLEQFAEVGKKLALV